jgi:uncharacterized membrane protein YhiD involved in acid resistance
MSEIKIMEILQGTNLDITPYEIITNLVIALILSLLIYMIYKMTYSGAVYIKSFSITLVLVTLVTSMVIMVIGSNLAMSLGMVGALSIIRFRSAIKDPKDSAYLFWGIATGLACGAGAFIIAIIGYLFIAFLMLVFSIEIFNTNNYLLIIHGNKIIFDEIDKVVHSECNRKKIRMKNISSEKCELIYEVKFSKNKENTIIEKLNEIDNLLTINIVSYNGDSV